MKLQFDICFICLMIYKRLNFSSLLINIIRSLLILSPAVTRCERRFERTEDRTGAAQQTRRGTAD